MAAKVKKGGGKINVEDVDPTEIGNAVFNPVVCLEFIRYFFTEEAWVRFRGYYDSKAQYLKYMCNFCNKTEENGDGLIACEHCLQSFHYQCVKLKKVVKKRQTWFCAPCKAEERLQNEEEQKELSFQNKTLVITEEQKTNKNQILCFKSNVF